MIKSCLTIYFLTITATLAATLARLSTATAARPGAASSGAAAGSRYTLVRASSRLAAVAVAEEEAATRLLADMETGHLLAPGQE